MNNIKVRVPSHLFLTGIFSSSITLVLSVTYMVLSVVALVYRSNCELDPQDIAGSGYFLNVLFRLYIQKDECPNSMKWESVTEADSVLLLVVITLTASCLTMIAAITFITVLSYEVRSRYVQLAAYVYVSVCVASLVVDVTLGTHFGIDYSNMNAELNMNSPGLNMNYTRDVVRLVAFTLMTISLKGFVAHAVNIALLILIVVYVADYQKLKQTDEHSIHKLGALNAYEHLRRQEDSTGTYVLPSRESNPGTYVLPRREDAWQPQPDMFLGSPRGPHVNPAYLNDDESLPRTPMREQLASDYSSRLYERSESWKPGPANGVRPFSYLEEAKRPIPVKSPTVAAAEPQWNRNQEPQWSRNQEPQWNRNQEPQWNRTQWPQAPPPVPAPDYSPPSARRLKSVLKPAYT